MLLNLTLAAAAVEGALIADGFVASYLLFVQ
jgi:hypothetical protein